MKSKTLGNLRSILAHVVLIILSFMCLFFFYILFVNATRSHAELQKGFSALPGGAFFTNLQNVVNRWNLSNGSGHFEQLGCFRMFCGNLYIFLSTDSIWTVRV